MPFLKLKNLFSYLEKTRFFKSVNLTISIFKLLLVSAADLDDHKVFTVSQLFLVFLHTGKNKFDMT